jgi:hypothetical protein
MNIDKNNLNTLISNISRSNHTIRSQHARLDLFFIL